MTGLVEVKNYDGEGYQALVRYGAWRVAILRFLDELNPGNIRSMERHTATDEVFILTKGRAMLITGGNEAHISGIQTVEMNIGEVYNIKKNTWHTLALSPDAHIIVVENDDTAVENTEQALLPGRLQAAIRKISAGYIHGR